MSTFSPFFNCVKLFFFLKSAFSQKCTHFEREKKHSRKWHNKNIRTNNNNNNTAKTYKWLRKNANYNVRNYCTMTLKLYFCFHRYIHVDKHLSAIYSNDSCAVSISISLHCTRSLLNA